MSVHLVTSAGTVVDLSTIEGVDLDADIPCGHSQHEARHPCEPAAYIVVALALCPCGPPVTYPLCKGGWDWFGNGSVVCSSCGGCWPRDEVLRIVEVLR